jgi:hypothetical protein
MQQATEDEDDLEVFFVLMHRRVVHKYFIHANQDELQKSRLEHAIHDALEHRLRIAQAKRHHVELVVALVCFERHFVFISWQDPNLMAPCAKVQFGEHLCAGQLVEELVDHCHQEHILDRELVQSSIVHTKMR